jgi:hypothetical protein
MTTRIESRHLSPKPQVAGNEELCPAACVELHEGDALVVWLAALHLVPGQQHKDPLGIGGEGGQDVADGGEL